MCPRRSSLSWGDTRVPLWYFRNQNTEAVSKVPVTSHCTFTRSKRKRFVLYGMGSDQQQRGGCSAAMHAPRWVEEEGGHFSPSQKFLTEEVVYKLGAHKSPGSRNRGEGGVTDRKRHAGKGRHMNTISHVRQGACTRKTKVLLILQIKKKVGHILEHALKPLVGGALTPAENQNTERLSCLSFTFTKKEDCWT